MATDSRPPELEKAKRGRFRPARIRLAGEPSGIELIEEGVNLLRRTPLGAWSIYFSGLAPFLVGFLFFWTEMATSGLAVHVLVPASFGMSLLFIWLKVTQSYFIKGLREALVGQADQPWSFRVWLRVLRRQMFWQPTGLILLPVAFVLTVPFAWTYAFYQNLLASDPYDEDDSALSNWRLARLWTEQNWMLLALLSLVIILSLLNWLSLLFFGPYLLKALFGVETVFSRAGPSLFNSTSFFACLLLAYAVTDPLVKSVYLLRRHYSESRRSGADLLLRLRRCRLSRQAAQKVALILVGLLVIQIEPVSNSLQASERANENRGLHSEMAIQANELDASIDSVLTGREYVWRFPREATEEIGENQWWEMLKEKLQQFQERIQLWLEEFFQSDTKDLDSEWGIFDGDLWGIGKVLSYVLIGVFVLVVLYFGFRAWRMYEPLEELRGTSGGDLVGVPDLEDEDVSADLLPRNRWVELAQDLIEKGEYRQALRAYFLAQLSDFSSEGLIVIQRAKSNREYGRELAKRGHGRHSLLDVYGLQVRLFESTWYGGHASGLEEIEEMENYLKEQGVAL